MAQHALDPNHIRVLSWNIAKGHRRGWRQDFARLSHNVDLALIQEARLEQDMPRLMSDYSWAFAPGYQRPNLTSGVLTLSRAETLLHRPHSHREPLIRAPKAALITEYRLRDTDQTLKVANIHAINFTPGTRHFQTQLEAIHSALRNHDGPLIVSGDFNTWRPQRYAVLAALVEALHLQDIAYQEDCRRQAFGQALDHILYRGLEYQSCRVSPVASSDHNPIRATLRLAA